MVIIPNIEGQTFAVLGLGKSGLATAASLRASKAEAVLWDDNPKARVEAEQAGYKTADPMQMNISRLKALILSPGVPHSFPKPHPLVEKCRAAGIEIIGDIELLFRAQPDAAFAGITGTNGKSTTTALIGHILKTAGRKVQTGGNLGLPALSLAPLGKDGIYVLELSSYQLELIAHNPLRIAVLLNITPDHLDRHGGMQGYIDAKARIFNLAPGPRILVMGTGEPESRALILQAKKQSHIKIEEIEKCGLETMIEPSALPALPGKHNWQNACAAFLACRALGLSNEQIAEGLKNFPGLAHRQQVIAEIDGVRFINDSKATNADAAGKALACYENIYWILGGKPKEGGLRGLESFTPRIRHAFLIGEASDDFAAWCDGKLAYTLCGTLDAAVQQAAQMARRDRLPEAVVLLSPACASFDQFTNFEERGRAFGAYVDALRHVPEQRNRA
jgi:UDP-N-acetylmuramoylalanine--D-glutamate ligase